MVDLVVPPGVRAPFACFTQHQGPEAQTAYTFANTGGSTQKDEAEWI